MPLLPSLPPRSFFNLPPTHNPVTLVPPSSAYVSHSTHPVPFTIPADTFHALLDVRVPITIAATYAVSVVIMNRVNASRGFKPWGISKTGVFHVLVILHNVLLAVYSAWTFLGMTAGFLRTINTHQGAAGFVDSLCKMHGEAGLGRASTYAPASFRQHWMAPEYTSGLMAPVHPPSPLQPGRLWNEGLAFYGWIFYLSKFYEVVDTMIILAKGKKSSTLQTYHHAGAMMCMWAGIKYMAPPIWMFVEINSFIHALMYTYYTLTALSVRVPKALKQSLTTLQIFQFLFGGSYALVHFFLSYTMPAVVDRPTSSPDHHTAHHLASTTRTVRCIDTEGEAFAIWLNVAYLAPLTWLFMRFFVRSYLKAPAAGARADGKRDAREQARKVEKAAGDAVKGVSREARDL